MAKCKHNDSDLTPNEVSNILNKNYRTVLRWVKEGKFPNAYVCSECGANLIPSSDVNKHIESLKIGV